MWTQPTLVLKLKLPGGTSGGLLSHLLLRAGLLWSQSWLLRAVSSQALRTSTEENAPSLATCSTDSLSQG